MRVAFHINHIPRPTTTIPLTFALGETRMSESSLMLIKSNVTNYNTKEIILSIFLKIHLCKQYQSCLIVVKGSFISYHPQLMRKVQKQAFLFLEAVTFSLFCSWLYCYFPIFSRLHSPKSRRQHQNMKNIGAEQETCTCRLGEGK